MPVGVETRSSIFCWPFAHLVKVRPQWMQFFWRTGFGVSQSGQDFLPHPRRSPSLFLRTQTVDQTVTGQRVHREVSHLFAAASHIDSSCSSGRFCCSSAPNTSSMIGEGVRWSALFAVFSR